MRPAVGAGARLDGWWLGGWFARDAEPRRPPCEAATSGAFAPTSSNSVAASARMSTGFGMKPLIPAAVAATRSFSKAFAVVATMGTSPAAPGRSRIAREARSPSSPGMRTSIRIAA